MPSLRRIRSAITGRFVKRSTGARHPRETVSESATVAGGHGWTKVVAPPDPSTRPSGPPTAPASERTGIELRQAVLLAAAEAVIDTERESGGFESYVDSSALRRLRTAIDAVKGTI